MVRMMDMPLVKPRWLFPVTFSFMRLEMASSRICCVVFPGAEIRLASHSSLDPPSWRWAWHLSLTVVRDHCQVPGPCKNGRAWPHNNVTSSLSTLRCGPSSPMDFCTFIPFAVIRPVKWSLNHPSSMVDILLLLQTLPLDAGTWEVWQQTLQVKTEGNQVLSASVFSLSFDTKLHLIRQ